MTGIPLTPIATDEKLPVVPAESTVVNVAVEQVTVVQAATRKSPFVPS